MNSADNKSPRSIGVLLHPTALPSDYFCGTFGSQTKKWIRYLAKYQIGVWQFLPLSPTDSTGSPYSSPSGFALNPWFLDEDDLIQEGFIPKIVRKESQSILHIKTSELNIASANSFSRELGRNLRDAWFKQTKEKHKEFKNWCNREDYWLEDYVSFAELRRQFNERPWWEWPKDFADHNEDVINEWKNINQNKLLEHRLIQWHLDRQWKSIRCLSKDIGITLLGDMPFYISRDSSDVWGNRTLFSIGSSGDLYSQSGVPPDYFSSTGQLWGTPVYRWEEHSIDKFSWWRKRFLRQWELVDILRLDHFRGLESFWQIPGDQETAENGIWEKSPGKELLNFIREDKKGFLPLVAEDLGIITKEVEQLRDDFNLLGMKILQFAFDGDPKNPYLPENIMGNKWIIYSGTHDNQTTLGWWIGLARKKKEEIEKRFFDKFDSPAWKIIDLGMSTEARLFVAPIQDILDLDDQSRFNQPGTKEGNWTWRINKYDKYLEERLKAYGDRAIYWNRSFKEARHLFSQD